MGVNESKRQAVWLERLDVEAPNAHIEVLLMFGQCPSNDDSPAYHQWHRDMRQFMYDRYGFRLANPPLASIATGVIMRRIAKEVES